MKLADARLVFLDVETTGLSPAMGDRVIEIGLIACSPGRKPRQASQLINPGRPIPRNARRVHGIGDDDVASAPRFEAIADNVGSFLHGAWLVGHNLRFDVGFLAMEFALAGLRVEPAGCLDTCQLAPAAWDLADYKLGTLVAHLEINQATRHRALADALATQAVFARILDAMGDREDIEDLTVADLHALHRYVPTWPPHPERVLPRPLFDALTSGRPITICYQNGDGITSSRMIRPHACFPVGRNVYLKAHCMEAAEMRTFRLDRIVEVTDATVLSP